MHIISFLLTSPKKPLKKKTIILRNYTADIGCNIYCTMVLLYYTVVHSRFLPHAVNCGQFCFWSCQSVTARSKLRKVPFLALSDFFIFLFVHQIPREPLNWFAPNWRRRRVWSFARTSLNAKVKGQRSRSPGKISSLLEMHCNAFAANNVMHAADWTIPSLPGVTEMHSGGLHAVYVW